MKKIAWLSTLLINICFLHSHQAANTSPSVPLTCGIRNNALIPVKIEGNDYIFTFDLTSHTFISENIVKNIKSKKRLGIHRLVTSSNKSYIVEKYTLPEIKVGNIKLKNMEFLEDPNEHIEDIFPDSIKIKNDGTIIHYETGVIGSELLKLYCLLFDFDACRLYFLKGVEELKKLGYKLDSFIQTPYFLGPNFLEIDVETDLGLKRFIVNFNIPVSRIKRTLLSQADSQDPFLSEKFVIGGHDFGKMALKGQNFEAIPSIDGCLGMDFLEKYILFFDATRQVLMVGHAR